MEPNMSEDVIDSNLNIAKFQNSLGDVETLIVPPWLCAEEFAITLGVESGLMWKVVTPS
jgi:hypothetical protein